jgi:hypothetical protein
MVKAMRAAPNHSRHRFREANSKPLGGAYRRRALNHAEPGHGQGARLMVSGPLFLAFVICQVPSHSAIASCAPLRFFKQCLLSRSLCPISRECREHVHSGKKDGPVELNRAFVCSKYSSPNPAWL